ncbi:MAG: DUF3137 domain-containing protein [Aureispira sp.]|nr:DUF3137 domain-containing protein [Aureispira sp.]
MDIWVGVSILGGFFVLNYFFVGYLNRKNDRNIEDLAEEYDLEIQNLNPKGQVLHQKAVSRTMGIEIYNDHKGEDQISFVELYWRCSNKDELALSLYPEGYISKLRKVFGMQDIIINKPLFDKRFIIKSNEPICTLELLDNAFCEQLLELDQTILCGRYEFRLAQGKLYYTEANTEFSSVDDYNRIIDLIELGQHLAQNISNYKLPG